MAKIKVLVCCHKATYVPNDDVYLPIQVGKANSKIDLGFQGDDEGKILVKRTFLIVSSLQFIGHGKILRILIT